VTHQHFADQFNAVAPYYDEIMSVVPYRQWVQYLRRILKRRGWQPQTVLDVACGTGTVALLLAEEGISVTGIDLAPGMIEAARRKARQTRLPVDFLVADATALDFAPTFDLAISLFDSLNYILSTRGFRDALASVHGSLRPGGGFVFDLNSEYALEKNLFSQDNLWDKTADVKHIWRAHYNARTRVATIDMEFFLSDGRVFHEVHKERAHRHADVLTFLAETGFEVLDTYDAYTFLPPGRRSERIFYVARKA
jgi:SAM-dependent methyltransferase